MSFISLEFVLFMVVVVPLYFLTPKRFRSLFLLVASYYFYTRWNADYLILIVFSTLVDYFISNFLSASQQAHENLKTFRRLLLMVSVVTNLGVLFVFKYYNFFADSIITLANMADVPVSVTAIDVLLPVGISFYTFQSMAYTIDVYRGKIKAERSLTRFAAYIAFFPQLVAGPIERASNLLPQFHEKHRFDVDRVTSGLRVILWGAFKKVVIADRLAIFVDHIYANPEGFGGSAMLLATVFFGIQIYCDFSGYSDMAIGTARILGFDLMENFRYPYFALSIRDFWRRWHISLSTWFRDYVYFPLGGNRVSLIRNLFNLFVVFLISGLWHGAAWTFVIWGAVHGIFIALETLFDRLNITLPRILRIQPLCWLYTFGIVTLLWAFFRATDVSHVFYMFTHLTDFGAGLDPLSAYTTPYFEPIVEFAISLGVIAILFLVDWLDKDYQVIQNFGRAPVFIKYPVYYFLSFSVILSFMLYGLNLEPTFIYFQF